MKTRVPIGDFSRATHLSIKTLRHYHEIGLLEPSDIDPDTGYRYYSEQQLPDAQIIRRLRGLQMPTADIKAVLATSSADTRNGIIVAHLDRLESELAETRTAVTELRALLDRPQLAVEVSHRTMPGTAAIAIDESVDHSTIVPWWQGALAELQAVTRAQALRVTGPPGGIYDCEIFQHGHGRARVYIPVDGTPRAAGRAAPDQIPHAELAVLLHQGSLATVDLTYSQLTGYAHKHEISIGGPLREYYLTGYLETRDPSLWQTEIGWPIFRLDS
jgi:DNA-binding transcriptional MerR regulator